MTSEQLAADRALIDAATPGPWLSGHNDGGPTVIPSGADSAGWPHSPIYTHSAADRDFIAAARTRWPAALDRIEQLEKENAALRRHVADLKQRLNRDDYGRAEK